MYNDGDEPSAKYGATDNTLFDPTPAKPTTVPLVIVLPVVFCTTVYCSSEASSMDDWSSWKNRNQARLANAP
jgi:hypothetical protein